MKRSELVYDFICDFKRDHDGNSPSFREIGRGCSISSTSLVNYYLNKLIDQERVYVDLDTRKIVVCGAQWLDPEVVKPSR
jgi:hypothetical protein